MEKRKNKDYSSSVTEPDVLPNGIVIKWLHHLSRPCSRRRKDLAFPYHKLSKPSWTVKHLFVGRDWSEGILWCKFLHICWFQHHHAKSFVKTVCSHWVSFLEIPVQLEVSGKDLHQAVEQGWFHPYKCIICAHVPGLDGLCHMLLYSCSLETN